MAAAATMHSWIMPGKLTFAMVGGRINLDTTWSGKGFVEDQITVKVVDP